MMKFAKEREKEELIGQAWKVLIVDDEEEVHQITKMVLSKFEFEKQGITTLSAYSGEEAIEVLKEHPDIALILLDVVMQSDDDGLKAVRRIREELNNTMVRIILRTGQPGSAPEYEVIRDYDINDYKEKTELTVEKLYTTVIASLRAYRDLNIIEQNRLGLKSIIEASSTIFQLQSFKNFSQGVMTQLLALISIHSKELKKNAFSVLKDKNGYQILASSGRFENRSEDELISEHVEGLFKEAIKEKQHISSNHEHVYYFETTKGNGSLFYYIGDDSLDEVDRSLVDIFSVNVSVALENIALSQEINDRQKAKLSQMGEIISMIAHQWRQPLATINAMTANIQLGITMGDKLSDQELSDSLTCIEERTALLSKTIDDFRNFYKPNKSKNYFQLEDLIVQCIKILEPNFLDADVTVNQECNVQKQLYSYESEILQVLINLIKNATDALEIRSEDRQITISTCEDESSVYITVSDNAGGIPPEIISKVFDPYFSTKTSKNGTGLGLYMSKLIIEDHCCGDISVENIQEGAQFTIALPLS